MRRQEKIKIIAAAIAMGVLILDTSADTVVTQTINNVEWRFRLNPSAGTATLGLDDSGYNNEAKRASWG